MKNVYAFLFVALATVSSCKKGSSPDDTIYKVEYTIGCSDCMVAYVSDQKGTQLSEYHKSTGWTYTFNAKKNQEVLLMAYNTSSAPQGVTATIKLNNSVIATQTNYCAISGISFCADTIR